MVDKIKKALGKLKDEKLYSPEDILALGLVVNTKLQPSTFTVLRLIKNGKLPAVNLATGVQPRYFVKGADLKKYIKETYKI